MIDCNQKCKIDFHYLFFFTVSILGDRKSEALI